MNESGLTLVKIIFLFGFTLHNIEEAVWLPQWSQYAKRFQEPVESNQFIFAVIIITMMGFLLTALDVLWGHSASLINYLYLGFIGMMGINTLFPHLVTTVLLKKYSPGLITALFLNLPLSLIIIFLSIKNGTPTIWVLLSVLIMSLVVVTSLRYLFKLGRVLINFTEN